MRYFKAVLIVFFPSMLWAHNTNVTHPIITLEAIRLIKSSDSAQQFSELYREVTDKNIFKGEQYPLHWGGWNSAVRVEKIVNGKTLQRYKSEDEFRLYNDMKASEADETLFSPYNKIYKRNDVNVISGVVRGNLAEAQKYLTPE